MKPRPFNKPLLTPNHETNTPSLSTALFSIILVVFDEYGRPFIILKEQQQKARVKGVEAQKVSSLEFKLLAHNTIYSKFPYL